jgi:triosephosphate isomerase (TIM)
MDRKIWIIANWKSNKTIGEALQWLEIVGPKLRRDSRIQVAVCPPFTDIEEVKKKVMVGNFPIMVGAQDLSPFEDGPHTGEESARILKDIVDLAILGHSERRQSFGETDAVVAEKVMRAREFQIEPVVCVQDENTPVPENVAVVAFEPVFAIGSGQPDTPDNAAKVAETIRQKYDQKLAVLYGGSVTSENAKIFLQRSELSGLLIGGASLDPEEFVKIVEVAYSTSAGVLENEAS